MSDPPRSLRLKPSIDFWSRGSVLEALTDQDAGGLFRLLRQYTGASQQRVGAAVDMAQPHVSEIMAGKRKVTALRSWQRIAEGLGMPNEPRRILGLAPAEGVPDDDSAHPGSSRVTTDDLWSASRTVQDITEFTLKDLMKRRDALMVGGALVMGTALTEVLERWQLSASDLTGPLKGTLNESELVRIEATTAALRHWDDRWHLGIRRKAVVGQLAEVSELFGSPQSTAVQRRLFMVMAELSKIIASMSYDAGDHPNAQQYYAAALRTTRQAGSEHRLYGVGILADMSRQMLDVKRPQDALESAAYHREPIVAEMRSELSHTLLA